MTEPKNQKDNTELWDKNRGVIRSSVGGWVIGQGVMNRGYDMMEDFVGKLSYMQVVIFNATGRLVSPEFARWCEGLYVCLSWPDSRIWCNHIGALGGSLRASPVASTVAGVLATDARSYGVKPIVEGMEFIQGAKRQQDEGKTIEEIVQTESARFGGKPLMMGYARPIAKGDERIPALERAREELGLPFGPHLALAFEVDRYLHDVYGESMNVNGYASAMMSDHGFLPQEAYRIYPVVVASGVTACYVDSFDKAPETFMPMKCEDMDYQGPAPRSVPDPE